MKAYERDTFCCCCYCFFCLPVKSPFFSWAAKKALSRSQAFQKLITQVIYDLIWDFAGAKDQR
jgi:hypothetical protein